MKPLNLVLEKYHLTAKDVEAYGDFKAKFTWPSLQRLNVLPSRGQLVLVSAVSPTKSGEGKTTVSIGLAEAINRIGYSAIAALREPSLGPCFGMKGGATGGGQSQLEPSEDINLHFNGDFHAITSAHNLIAALLHNHMHFGAKPALKEIYWKRVMDMNDRALRSEFDITAASEIMAIVCLSRNIRDLKSKVGRILLGLDEEGKPFYAHQLGCEGAVGALLANALRPNLVQTTAGDLAIVHGGPFANIAQGTSSILATQTALKLSDFVVTEAGFGFDLGGEKFFDLVSPYGGFAPQVVILVATLQSVKFHGGYENLLAHLQNVRRFGVEAIVAINRFPQDTESELSALQAVCASVQVKSSVVEVWAKGGEGALELAKMVVESVEGGGTKQVKTLYDWGHSAEEKILAVAQQIYGAKEVVYQESAAKTLALMKRFPDDFASLPVCIAKTPYSFSDDPKKVGRAQNFTLTVREIVLARGAGFIVPITGEIMRMPGLPKNPAALKIDVDDEGKVLFPR